MVWFEARLGYNQPQNNSTVIIANFDHDASRNERVVRLTVPYYRNYIAANRWPKVWYRQALKNSELAVKLKDFFESYWLCLCRVVSLILLREVVSLDLSFGLE